MLTATLERMVSQAQELIASRYAAAMRSSHSLRAGFLTPATSAGADAFRVMDVSGQRKFDTVRGYIWRAKIFKLHAVAGFM
jgi:hypothetical protein